MHSIRISFLRKDMHSLMMYSISLRDRAQRTPENPTGQLNLKDIYGNDLIDLVNNFCSNYTADYVKVTEDDEIKSAIKISSVTVSDRFISGLVEYGYYGIAGKLVDVITSKTKKKTKNDVDVHNLYFCFYVPENSNFGIALFHRVNKTSVKSIFDKRLNNDKDFLEGTSNLKLRIVPITKEKDVRNLMARAQIKKIILERFKDKSMLGDLADRLPVGSNVTVTISAPRDGMIGTALDWSRENIEGKYSKSVDVLSNMCETVKSDVKLLGKTRRTTLENQGVESRLEFTNKDVEMIDQEIIFDSMDEFSRAIAVELNEDR
jgi:hypothetical protein